MIQGKENALHWRAGEEGWMTGSAEKKEEGQATEGYNLMNLCPGIIFRIRFPLVWLLFMLV